MSSMMSRLHSEIQRGFGHSRARIPYEVIHMQLIFLVVAIVLAAIGAWSRWWPASPAPYYPTLISAALFFYFLSILVSNPAFHLG
jgi:hypothetical protein